MKEWFYALIIALAMSCAYMLDGEATTLITEYDRQTKSQAYQTCRDIGGPNAWYVITDAGKLVCLNKRGNKLSRQPE